MVGDLCETVQNRFAAEVRVFRTQVDAGTNAG